MHKYNTDHVVVDIVCVSLCDVCDRGTIYMPVRVHTAQNGASTKGFSYHQRAVASPVRRFHLWLDVFKL